MGIPAKGWNAYKHDQGRETKVSPPSRKDIVCEKHYNSSGQPLKTGFEPNGRPCSKPTKSYD